jgi:hypothetical protein
LIVDTYISSIVYIFAFLLSSVAPNRLHSDLHLSLMTTATEGKPDLNNLSK